MHRNNEDSNVKTYLYLIEWADHSEQNISEEVDYRLLGHAGI